MKYDVVIIGAGLGGMLCANMLSREGLNVCLLEKNKRVGGCIQSFARDGVIFNTGLNYTESLSDGEVLHRYFKYCQIMDKLKVRRMAPEGFERMSFQGDSNEYPFAQGHQNFVDSLSVFFPEERENLQRYISVIQDVCHSFPYYSLEPPYDRPAKTEYLTTGARDFLKSITPNIKLQQILAGMNSLYAGVANKTPLYMHALINSMYIGSAWRVVDGSSQIGVQLCKVLRKNGGTIRKGEKVVSLSGKNKKITHAILESGEKIYAEKFISNIHPATTLKLVNPDLNKRGYSTRISQLENTIGMFSLYAVLKKDSFPYLNYNHHYFKDVNAWTAGYKEKQWPEHYMMYTPASSKSEKWAKGLIGITYMNYDEVRKWERTTVEQRGREYEEFKCQKAEQLINLMAEKFPDIRSHIDHYYTSTPLTYRDYTGTPEGSAYGILKDYHDPLSTIISPKTRIGNLLFTGQNLNMHGISGVTIGAVMTCAEFVGADYLLNKIKTC